MGATLENRRSAEAKLHRLGASLNGNADNLAAFGRVLPKDQIQERAEGAGDDG